MQRDGIEPPTTLDFTQVLYLTELPLQMFGSGDWNRTNILRLTAVCSAFELHRIILVPTVGFEPTSTLGLSQVHMPILLRGQICGSQ